MKMGSNPYCTPAPPSGLFSVSPFSAFHLLRNYNYLLSPQPPEFPKLSPTRIINERPLRSPKTEEVSSLRLDIPLSHNPLLTSSSSLLAYAPLVSEPVGGRSSSLSSTCSTILNNNFRRQRGEKKPIPDEQKDDKYYERRRRNNQAAKKSRDARKIREDQIALRATILEHENAILKAQVLTLREEASSLRQMLIQKTSMDLSSSEQS